MQCSSLIGLTAASSILVKANPLVSWELPTSGKSARSMITTGPPVQRGDDTLQCSDNLPLMDLDSFDKLRQAFCNAYVGRVVPLGHELSVQLDTVAVDKKPIKLLGKMLCSTAERLQNGYAIQAHECLDLTSTMMTEEGCVTKGQTAGGIYYQNTWGVSFAVNTDVAPNRV